MSWPSRQINITNTDDVDIFLKFQVPVQVPSLNVKLVSLPVPVELVEEDNQIIYQQCASAYRLMKISFIIDR
jgi:hypothetical protein